MDFELRGQSRRSYISRALLVGGAGVAALLAVTTAAALVPAFRAIRVNPITILRAE
jgi:ABC-type antimicrobial peptide transport system permease subunit